MHNFVKLLPLIAATTAIITAVASLSLTSDTTDNVNNLRERLDEYFNTSDEYRGTKAGFTREGN